MNKKLSLFFTSLVAVAIPVATTVSCGKKSNEIISAPVRTLNFLKGQDTSDFVKTSNSIYEKNGELYSTHTFDSVDQIICPSTIAVANINHDLVSQIKFIKDYQLIESRYSDLIKFKTDSSDWEISNGKVTKFAPHSTTKLTITIGQVTKDVTLINRNAIKNSNILSATKNFDITNIATTHTPAEDFSVTKGDLIVEGKTYTGINYSWTDKNPSTPRINLITGFWPKDGALNRRVTIDATVPNLGLLIYVPKSSANEQIWFRSGYNITDNVDTPNHGIDFNAQKASLNEGWNLIQVDITGKFTDTENWLTALRPIMLSANNASGSFFLGGIFQSDEDMHVEELVKTIEK